MTILPSLMNEWHETPTVGRRVVFFGSSNTELAAHNLGRHSWSCWVEIALRSYVGKHIITANAGIGGETVYQLRQRVDRDVLPIRPDLVIVTIGGNDRWQLSPAQYRRQMGQLVDTLKASGTLPVLQTYYSLLMEDENQPMEMLTPYMDAKREVAQEAGVPCIDSYPIMHRWHQADPDGYRALMLDPGHLNPTGHAVYGRLCSEAFGVFDLPLPEDLPTQPALG